MTCYNTLLRPFEFGAFIIAATGSVRLGLVMWGIDSGPAIGTPVGAWGHLFLLGSVPLQFVGAFLDA